MKLHTIFQTCARLLASLAFAAGIGNATADTYPSRPITLVVPFGAGSTTDVVARAFASDLSVVLNSPVIVDNKPGANQTVAGPYVYRAKPDGYTLFMPVLPTAVLPAIQAKLPYAGMRSFTPISDVLKIGFTLVAAPSVQANNLQEFIALVRKDPTKHSYGSTGVSTALHLYAEMFNKEIGVKTVHVPYKGSNEVVMDVMADRLTYAFVPTGAMDFVRAGKLKGYGILAEKRDPAYPELPTLEEAGLPGFKTAVNILFVGPPHLPADVLKKLNEASNQVLANPAFFAKVKSIGSVQVSQPATPAKVGADIAAGEALWDAVIKSANIQAE